MYMIGRHNIFLTIVQHSDLQIVDNCLTMVCSPSVHALFTSNTLTSIFCARPPPFFCTCPTRSLPTFWCMPLLFFNVAFFVHAPFFSVHATFTSNPWDTHYQFSIKTLLSIHFCENVLSQSVTIVVFEKYRQLSSFRFWDD